MSTPISPPAGTAAQAGLRADDRLRDLIPRMPGAIAMFDRDMRCIAASRRWKLDYGISVDADASGRSYYEIFPETPERWLAAHRRAMAGETVRCDEDHFSRIDGRIQWLRWEVLPWIAADGRIGGVVIMSEDMNERRAAQVALLHSESQLAAELAVLQRLRSIGIALVRNHDLSELTRSIVDAAIEFAGADKGYIQLFDRSDGMLRIVSHRGYEAAFLDHFSAVPDGRACCGLSLGSGQRVSIEDVSSSPIFIGTPDFAMMQSAGIVSCCSTPLLTRAGRITGVVSVHYATRHIMAERELRALDLLARQAADLLDQADTQRKLRESEERLRRVFDVADVGLTRSSREGVYLSVNPAFAKIAGKPIDQIVGKTIAEVMGAEAAEATRPYLDRALKGERVTYEAEVPFDSTGRRYLHVNYSPDIDSSGVVVGWVASITDITKRKEAEKQLKESHDHLTAILETVVDALVTIDSRGIILSVNAATERMFGYTASEMIGRNVSMLMPAPYRDEHDTYIERFLTTGVPRIIGIGREVVALRKDGTQFPIDLSIGREDSRNVFTGAIRDISARKHAEFQLRQSERLAAIGTLAAGLGHDMNNMLLPVRAHLNVLIAERSALSGRAGQSIDAIVSSVSYLQQLTDALQYLATDLESDGAQGAATDLCVWWALAGPVLAKAVPKHVKVVSSFPAGLPHVGITSHALTQAVLNLIVNAGDSMPIDRMRKQGRVRISAEADASHQPHTVRLTVSDNGCGMERETMRRAFELFFTTKPRGMGTGLGLALVKRVMDRAGGSVEIDSEPDQGTTVTLALPTVLASMRERQKSIPAAITMRDGRAAAMVRHLLEAEGVRCTFTETPGDTMIWITEPKDELLPEARDWRQRIREKRRLIVVGRQTGGRAAVPAAWSELEPLAIVEDPNDFEALKAAVALAVRGI